MHAFSADALNHACYSSVKTCSWVHLHSCESVLGALLSSGPSCLPCPSRGGWQSEAQQHSNTCAPSLQHYVATCCDQHGLFLAPARTAHGGAAQSGAQARAANLAASPRQGPALAEQQQTNFFTLTPWCRVVHRPSPALYLTCPRASCFLPLKYVLHKTLKCGDAEGLKRSWHSSGPSWVFACKRSAVQFAVQRAHEMVRCQLHSVCRALVLNARHTERSWQHTAS